MKTQQEDINPTIHANRQLREWSDNIGAEIKARYRLKGQHQREQDQLKLEAVHLDQQAALSTRHLQETAQLKEQQGQARTAMRKRHTDEQASLDGQPATNANNLREGTPADLFTRL